MYTPVASDDLLLLMREATPIIYAFVSCNTAASFDSVGKAGVRDEHGFGTILFADIPVAFPASV